MLTPRHWSIVSLPEYANFFRKETHLSRNMFLRIPIGNYIRHYSGCRRYGSYPCYTVASPPNNMDIVHRTARKKFSVACDFACHSFHNDGSKNSKHSSFQPDSLPDSMVVGFVFFVFVSTKRSDWSQCTRAKGKLSKCWFSYRVSACCLLSNFLYLVRLIKSSWFFFLSLRATPLKLNTFATQGRKLIPMAHGLFLM